MHRNTEHFISLLKAFIQEQESLQEQHIDWEEVYKLANIHSVSGMIYLMVKENPEEFRPAAPLLRIMKQDFTSTIVRAAEQDHEIHIIVQELSRAEISHMLLKGFAIKSYYPVKEMRTMGDIDILIKPSDREKSHVLLQELGFKATQTVGEVWNYSKGNVHLEIHTQLVYRNFNNKYDYITYFSSAWDNAVVQPNGYTFELSVEYHLLYLLVHMAKHFHGSGCGIRMIMDIAMYMIYFEDALDWDCLDREIEQLNLVQFASNIFILCQQWFGVSYPRMLPTMEEGFYQDIREYILSAGTFGFFQRNLQANRLRQIYEEQQGAEMFARLRLYLKVTFPSLEDMSKSPDYSFVKNKPFLLPAAWIYRIFNKALLQRKRTLRTLTRIAKGKKESQKQYEVISKLGL